MSRTVSFRCAEELDEYLEEEAERRMTTKSTVAQMLLTERVKQLKEERSEEVEEEADAPDEEGSSAPGVLERHDQHWYRPDGEKYNYAVRMPGDTDTKYYKTQEGAEDRLRKEYGE